MGDDLGSDDEYLNVISSNEQLVVVNEDRNIGESNDEQKQRSHDNPCFDSIGKKRKRNNSPGNDNDLKATQIGRKSAEPGRDMIDSSSKKERQRGGPLRVLKTRIRHESVESKAVILSNFTVKTFEPQHIARPQSRYNNSNTTVNMTSSIDSNNFLDRLLCYISKKQLKKVNAMTRKSPRAIIMCLSARRCVAVLKDLAPLKLRIAKLFPKQGAINDQTKQLESSEFGVAVGTPHRIQELLERGTLSLKNTQFIGLDTYENEKSFCVYTLPDTASYVKDILKNHIHPHFEVKQHEGGNLRIGFV